MKWPWARDPEALPPAEQRALGRRLRRALDQAADDAGIKPGGFPEDDEDSDQEK